MNPYEPKKHISLEALDVLKHLIANAVGRENAIRISELAFKFSNGRRREIELITEELRGASIPLCSSVSGKMGLFLARNYAEMQGWVEQINHRFRSMAINRSMAISTLKAQAEREGVQMEMELFNV